MGLRNFTMIIGPYYGAFTSCGSASNSVGGGSKTTFQCYAQAKGSSLKITNKAAEHLALCRVVAYGEGTLFLQI